MYNMFNNNYNNNNNEGEKVSGKKRFWGDFNKQLLKINLLL